jgi:hypothetical protein
LAQVKSLAPALLGTDSAIYFGGSLSVPDSLRKYLPAAFEEGFKKAMEKETDKDKKELAAQMYKALSPTLAAGEVDAAIDFRGPSTAGTYTLVAGIKVQDGINLEKSIKAIINKAPAEEKAKITLDLAKVGTNSIHKIDLGDMPDPEFKKLFGKSDVYIAFREDAMFMTAGENALAAIKAALAIEPKPGPVLRVEVSAARIAPILAREQKNAPQVAKEVFTIKGSDRISLVLEGGKEINLRATMKVQVLAFFLKLDDAKKGL